ncbi:MAG: hypothetical protein HXY19_02240 [Thermoanaerobaculaceae bacterium]|nr:hypothetical protein [Thermoanaerobaculaceae bacterium]
MNRHFARELRRQLRESGAVGGVAILLMAVATSWGGALLAARQWLQGQLLAQGREASIVAVLASPAESEPLRQALLAAFPQAAATALPPAAVRKQIASWFPEVATMLAGLPETSFPALLQVVVRTDDEPRLSAWLVARPEVTVAQSSRIWQRQLGEFASRLGWVGSAAAAVLLGGCLVVVLLVIRLLVLSHADEIAIMRLIGAHEAAIRGPYLGCGVTFGLAGGALGAVVLAALVLLVQSLVPTFALDPRLLLSLPPIGAAVGLAGALLGLVSLPREP